MQSADFHGAPIKCLRIRIHSQDSRSVVLLSRGATRSTMCRCNSLRHQNRDDSGRPRTRRRKRIDTTVVCIRARRLSSSIFTCSPLRVSNLQVFDLAIPRQPSGRATSSTWTLSERSSTPSVNDLLTSSSRSLTVLRKSERRTRPRRHIARLLANTAETAFDASTVPHRARTSRGARLLPVHGCSAPARPWVLGSCPSMGTGLGLGYQLSRHSLPAEPVSPLCNQGSETARSTSTTSRV
jgi:hypothetical protein